MGACCPRGCNLRFQAAFQVENAWAASAHPTSLHTPCARPNPPVLSINQRQPENHPPPFSGCLNLVGWAFMPTRSALQDCLKTRGQQVPALLIQNAGGNFRTQTNFNRTHYSVYFSLRKTATDCLCPNRQNRIRFFVYGGLKSVT